MTDINYISRDVELTISCFGRTATTNGVSKEIKDEMFRYYLQKLEEYFESFEGWVVDPKVKKESFVV